MKQKIRIWLRNFFGFSRTESNGFIILLVLMVIILAVPFLSKEIYFLYDNRLQSKDDKAHISSLLSELENRMVVNKQKKEEKRYQSFDLNKSTAEELKSSGFPKYLADRIVKYRENVSSFESHEDLLKIYGIDSAYYQKLRPYITVSRIDKKPNQKLPKGDADNPKVWKKKKIDKEPKKAKLVRFDLNKVDSAQLQKVYGIGPAYSKRIIKYRELLGGFHSLNQLSEVYGLRKANIDSLKRHVFVEDELNLKQLKVNHLNADSLVQHPYISYKEANLIINYRKQHGKFNSMESLLAIKILDSTWVQKVNPYISFD